MVHDPGATFLIPGPMEHFATCKSKNDPHGRELISKIGIANEKAWNCLNFDRAADHCAKPRQKINTRAKI